MDRKGKSSSVAAAQTSGLMTRNRLLQHTFTQHLPSFSSSECQRARAHRHTQTLIPSKLVLAFSLGFNSTEDLWPPEAWPQGILYPRKMSF